MSSKHKLSLTEPAGILHILRDINHAERDVVGKRMHPGVVTALQNDATTAFADVNGWKVSERGFTPDRIGLTTPGSSRGAWYGLCSGWIDHAIYFRAPRPGKRIGQNIAIVGQPYGHRMFDEERKALTEFGLVVHTPPGGIYASIWYPGATLFLVVTLPGVDVKWLPEQAAPSGLFEVHDAPALIGRQS